MQKNKILILYLPVIHKGYLDVIESQDFSQIYILSDEIIELIDQEFDYLRKEIRAISPLQAVDILKASYPKKNIQFLTKESLESLQNLKNSQSELNSNNTQIELYLPKEDIFIWLQEKFLGQCKTTFLNTFLRWNRKNINEHKKPETNITKQNLSDFENKFPKLVESLKIDLEKSSDWWRQVSAVVFNETTGEIVEIAHNEHLPTPYTPYLDSDPRNALHRGEGIELSTAIHAEAKTVANSAKEGKKLEGLSMLVSTFPCPPCAKLVAYSGIKKLYYLDGYAVLDGERVLKDQGVEVVEVKEN